MIRHELRASAGIIGIHFERYDRRAVTNYEARTPRVSLFAYPTNWASLLYYINESAIPIGLQCR